MRRFALPTICLLAALGASNLALAQQKKGGAPAGPGPKSQAEVQAVNAMIQAQTPDDKIKAVDELITKFANTDYKSFALEQEAEAYQQKGDNAKAIVYGEQALQADPKNFDADNLLANVTAATTKDTDLDKEEKLTRADKYAHDALDLLKTNEKPALQSNLTDEQWKQRKGAAESLSWQALGTTALVRKKTDEAVADFQKGVDAFPDPVLMVRTGRALLAAKRPDDAITWFEKVMNSADAPAQIKSIAQADRVRALQAKGTVPPSPK
jgi:tetratricopeptide (TPR) repeat protein